MVQSIFLLKQTNLDRPQHGSYRLVAAPKLLILQSSLKISSVPQNRFLRNVSNSRFILTSSESYAANVLSLILELRADICNNLFWCSCITFINVFFHRSLRLTDFLNISDIIMLVPVFFDIVDKSKHLKNR